MISSRQSLLALCSALLLAGCTTSDEERINKAIPVGREVEASKSALDAAAKAMDADVGKLEEDYANQLKIRALQCSHGYHPASFASDETIRKEIGNSECFAEADAALQRWLGLRRVGWAAAMPPLRPMPASAPMLMSNLQRVSRANFADAAGVAVLQSYDRYQLTDLNTGAEIRSGQLPDGGQLSLSPNGRLMVSNSGNKASLYDAESGELLAQFEGVSAGRMFWLGSRGLVYGKNSGGVTFLDIETNTESQLPTGGSMLTAVLPVPANASRFVLVSAERAALVELAPAGKVEPPRLLQEAKASVGYGGESGISSANGKLYYLRDRNLDQLDLATLETRIVELAPMSVSKVVPTRDPDKLLVFSRLASSEAIYLYSLSADSMAKVDTTALLSTQLFYVPSLKSNAYLDGQKVALIKDFTLAPPVPRTQVVAQARMEMQIAQLEMMDRLKQMQGIDPSARNALAAAYGAGSSYGRAAGSSIAPPAAPVARNYGTPQRFADGAEGLAAAIRAGVLRQGGAADIERWKQRWMIANGRVVKKEFDDYMRADKVYVITGFMTLPGDLFGAHSVVFIVGPGAPFPLGDPGHSPILDLNSGGCTGFACRVLTN